MRQHAPQRMDWNWNELLWWAVASAIFGALVSAGRRLYARLTPRTGAPAALAAVLALFLAVVYGLYRSPLGASYRESLALQHQQQRVARAEHLGEEAMKPVLALPEFQARIQGLSAEQVSELSMQLAAQGVLRLSDAQLVRRMQLLAEAIERSPEDACAAALAAMSPPQLLQMLSVLPEASLREWMALSADAVIAALRDAPARMTEAADVQRARETLLAAMPEPDRQRVAAALANPAQLDVHGACWTTRALYGTAAKLPPADAALVARVFAPR